MKRQIFLVSALILLMAASAWTQKSFYNKEFNVGFKTPAGSKLVRDPDTIAASTGFKGLAYITLARPGRGLFGAEAAVAAANITQSACRALSTEEDKPVKKRFGTVTFDKTTYVEGGMESVHPVESYRTFHSGVCYEIRLMVGMEKYPKRRVSGAPGFEKLYAILRTFYFR